MAQRGDAARRRLLAALGQVEARAAELKGRVRVVVRDEAADVWDVELRFPASSAPGMALAEHARRTGCPEHSLLELRFPVLFPAQPPALRAVRPRLLPPERHEVHEGGDECLPPTPSAAGACLPLTFGGCICLPELSPGAWKPKLDLTGVLLGVYERLLQGGAALDTESVRRYEAPPLLELGLNATLGLPTVARCVSRFPAASLERAAEIFPELALVPPGRLVLPQELASEVYKRAFGGEAGGGAVHVELKNLATGGRAFAGLAEVPAPQDSVVLAPSWLLRQLFLRDGDEVRVRIVTLPLCSLVRLQPHSSDFYDAVGGDARVILQAALAQLPALTAGLSVLVDLPCSGGGAVVRRAAVFIAGLEDESGAEVLAAKLPMHAGMLGDHEVRVDFRPARDLAESGSEYKERVIRQASEAEQVERLAKEQRARWREKRAAEALLAAAPGPTAEERARLGDGTEGLELCFRLPSGGQLRRRFAPELKVSDLKNFLRLLSEDGSSAWRPAPGASDIELSTAFPRRRLEDADVVSTIGNRAVVNVAEHRNGPVIDDDAAVDAGADAVLYPVALTTEVTCAGGETDNVAPAVDHAPKENFQELLGRAGAWVPPGSRENGLESLPEGELRALALSAGVPAADVARALDGAELAALLAERQASAFAGARPSHSRLARVPERGPPRAVARSASSRPTSRQEAPASSGSRQTSTSGSEAVGASPRICGCPLSAEQLAPLGLTPAEFMELPADTREAIAAVAEPAGQPTAQRQLSAVPTAPAVRSRAPRPQEAVPTAAPLTRAVSPLDLGLRGRRSASASPRPSSGSAPGPPDARGPLRRAGAVPGASASQAELTGPAAAPVRRVRSERRAGEAAGPPQRLAAAADRPPSSSTQSRSALPRGGGTPGPGDAAPAVTATGLLSRRPPAAPSRAQVSSPLRGAGQAIVSDDHSNHSSPLAEAVPSPAFSLAAAPSASRSVVAARSGSVGGSAVATRRTRSDVPVVAGVGAVGRPPLAVAGRSSSTSLRGGGGPGAAVVTSATVAARAGPAGGRRSNPLPTA